MRIPASECLVAVKNAPQQRTLFHTGPVAMICPLRDTNHVATGEYVFWPGALAGLSGSYDLVFAYGAMNRHGACAAWRASPPKAD